MLFNTFRVAALAFLLVALACSERPSTTGPAASNRMAVPSAGPGASAAEQLEIGRAHV